MTSPLAYCFYGVAFAMTALSRKDARLAQVAVTAYLVAVLGIALFYYPTTFTLEQQTTFGWVENDVYVGLLVALVDLVGAATAPDRTRAVTREAVTRVRWVPAARSNPA